MLEIVLRSVRGLRLLVHPVLHTEAGGRRRDLLLRSPQSNDSRIKVFQIGGQLLRAVPLGVKGDKGDFNFLGGPWSYFFHGRGDVGQGRGTEIRTMRISEKNQEIFLAEIEKLEGLSSMVREDNIPYFAHGAGGGWGLEFLPVKGIPDIGSPIVSDGQKRQGDDDKDKVIFLQIEKPKKVKGYFRWDNSSLLNAGGHVKVKNRI